MNPKCVALRMDATGVQLACDERGCCCRPLAELPGPGLQVGEPRGHDGLRGNREPVHHLGEAEDAPAPREPEGSLQALLAAGADKHLTHHGGYLCSNMEKAIAVVNGCVDPESVNDLHSRVQSSAAQQRSLNKLFCLCRAWL